MEIPHRLGRLLVVLALIVALLASSIPVPAQAVDFTPGLFALDATNLIISGARALGVGPGDDPLAFNNLITDAKSALFDGVSPLVNVWLDYVNGGFRAFLSVDFLARLLGFFFDSGALDKSSAFSTSFSGTLGDYSWTASSSGANFYMAVCTFETSTNARFLFLTDTYRGRIELYQDGKYYTTYYPHTSAGSYYYSCPAISEANYDDVTSSSFPYLGHFQDGDAFAAFLSGFEPSSRVTSNLDLSLDSVSDSLSASAYSDWSSAAQTIDEQQYFPVSIPSLSDSSAISTQTQAQAQAGTVPDSVADEIIAGADVSPDVVTLTDIFTAVRSVGADIVAAVQAVPAAIAAFFEPPTIYDSDGNVLPAYHVSLKDFFPFCLPFDIYDLISALAADPVAPVFEWTIAVPRWGISQVIEVDLSEWDDIARLFRTFELASFVLGLALITREKFLRS